MSRKRPRFGYDTNTRQFLCRIYSLFKDAKLIHTWCRFEPTWESKSDSNQEEPDLDLHVPAGPIMRSQGNEHVMQGLVIRIMEEHAAELHLEQVEVFNIIQFDLENGPITG